MEGPQGWYWEGVRPRFEAILGGGLVMEGRGEEEEWTYVDIGRMESLSERDISISLGTGFYGGEES